jgi:phosphate transport system permease protein
MRNAASKGNAFSVWWGGGSPWIWLTAGAVSLSILMVLGILGLIAYRGLSYFWPAPLARFVLQENTKAKPIPLLGELVEDEERLVAGVLRKRHLVKVGNRDLGGADFRWIEAGQMGEVAYPAQAVAVERAEWGDFFGYITGIAEDGQRLTTFSEDTLRERLARAEAIKVRIQTLERQEIGAVNHRLERLRLEERRQTLSGAPPPNPAALKAVASQREALQAEFQRLARELQKLQVEARRDTLVLTTEGGQETSLALAKVVRIYRPNAMDLPAKAQLYIDKLHEFLTAEPREANTEGGIFPAIFGTVLLVMIMSFFVTPFGVLSAVYLHEYAKQGLLTQIIRIAVNNLAGVPSVVYGVFGLGFFVYFVGQNIDRLFFAAALPSPTLGTPGILWSAITLALLTVPVVIVATEEGLSRIPRAIREGSLALGATKAETLWRTVLPMATPAMMTGLILAIARAAGEVAPLMMVGVVKLAPTLPLDGNFPYLHLERKFMHLGFHIYDVGFQSPNVEAARPLVYATALLLVLVIVLLNFLAIHIRNHLREKYRAFEG